MNSKKPTLQDVATHAGVSTATVSRYLNETDKVRPDVCKIVKNAIDELGYVPHGAARALASRRTRTIGAIVPTIDNAIFSEAIQYLQRGLSSSDYTLILAQSSFSMDEELREVRTMLSRGVDGLVLVGEEHHPEVYDAIDQHQIPFVNLWTYNPNSKYSCIGLDNVQAGFRLAEHLTNLGHKKIGFISAFIASNDRASQRLQGAKKCLNERGLELTDDWIVECRYSGEQGRLAMHELYANHPDITAVICGNDILALGALSAANKLKLKVPVDLSVTGFDNIEIIQILHPALTTMNVPSRRMGTHAANYLIEQIRADTTSLKRIELKTDLILRDTTAIVSPR